ncbi:MAG TPA: alpha-L-fucosidase [Vicinamibacteria bacterium]|nr:alpha-L-fucosidase [Vicinamibacteria bacterium]
MSVRLLAVFLFLFASPSVVSPVPHPHVADILKTVDGAVAQGPFQASWPSLQGFSVPDWYQGGKFGIFIHWGVYSVPAFGNEWYPRNMYRRGSPEFQHHLATYGAQSRFGYKDFIPRLTAEKFDAAAWARLFKEAGARYVVPVAEHHDGFPMYDCSLTEWSAAKMGPHRDIVGELARAVREQGLVLGVSSHRAEHWWFYDAGMELDSDVRDPSFFGFYGPARSQKKAEDRSEPPSREYLDDWLARTAELVDRYRPQLVWFDWWIEQPVFQPYLQRFAAFYYNRGAEWHQGVAINYKHRTFPKKTAVFDVERGQLPGIRPEFWQTDTSISKNSWGYVEKQDYKTVDSLVDDLVDIVSKNGTLLLNIGPKPDGTIPEPEQEVLRGIGAWLRTNGEAIYGTRPWNRFGEGPTEVVGGSFNDTKRTAFTGQDIRFTTRGGTLYAIALAWPREELTIHALAAGGAGGRVSDVALLGYDGRLQWSQEKDGLVIHLPAQPTGRYAFAFRITHAAEEHR